MNQDKVVPESFRILLRKYLGKPETKSLAPDGTPCTGTTRGLLQRARITAGKLVPVGKETDRRWEQGDDPSMIDSDIYIYEEREKLAIADPSERKRFKDIGWRRLARESKLSLDPVGKAIKGEGVRPDSFDYSTNGRQNCQWAIVRMSRPSMSTASVRRVSSCTLRAT